MQKNFYDDLLEILTRKYPRLREEKTRLFKVLHAFSDKVPLVESLVNHDLLAGVVLKKSSSEYQKTIVERIEAILKEAGIPINRTQSVYDRGDMGQYRYLKEGPLVVGDHGGYFAPSVESLRQSMGDALKGMTEHTLNGEIRLFQNAMSHMRGLPYVSTARIDLKDRSDRDIAEAAMGEISSMSYRTAGHDIYSRATNAEILIMGYGNMGMYTARALKEQNCQARVWVHDIRLKKLAFALQDGFQSICYDFEDILPQVDIIILATNTIKGDVPVLSAPHFGMMKPGVCIASMTSLEDEINLSRLVERGVISRMGQEEETAIYQSAAGKTVRLILDGRPANVRLPDGGAMDSICMIEAAGLLGSLKLPNMVSPARWTMRTAS